MPFFLVIVIIIVNYPTLPDRTLKHAQISSNSQITIVASPAAYLHWTEIEE